MNKIALLHRYPQHMIPETNAAFPYLKDKMDVLTFKKFDRLSKWKKFFKSLLWIFYAPMLVWRKGYDIIYIDDSYPFVPITVRLACPNSKIVLRLGDLHLMYYYNGLVYELLNFFEKIGWQLSDKILCISEPMRDYVSHEIRRGVDCVPDPVQEKGAYFLGGHSTSPESLKPFYKKKVMFHGVLTQNKNVDILIHAARKLPQYEFIIMGGGPEFNRLRKIAPVNVELDGWVDNQWINSRLNNCDIGVALRSDNPGNEYVVTSPFLQYGNMRKVCLVTRRKVFGDYKWQFSTVDELVEKISYLMENDAERLDEGEKLKKYITENHDAKKIAESIYHYLIN